jgi:hypothetical protein
MGTRPFSESGAVRYSPPQQIRPERSAAESTLLGIPGVKGVGEGRNAIGDPAWIVYIGDSAVASRLPKQVAGRTIITEVTGEIDILPA